MENNNKPCCPKFNPEGWDGKNITWKDQLFIKDAAVTFFHIPLNISKVIGRMWKKVQDAHAEPSMENWILLAYDPSPWKSEQYMIVSKEVPGAENVKISGSFLAKVYEGPYKDAKKWFYDMQKYVESKNLKPKKIYFYYTTCPKCVKIYGKNYVVALAEV